MAGRSGLLDLPYWNTGFVGTGPYKLREFVRSNYIKLAANDDFVTAC